MGRGGRQTRDPEVAGSTLDRYAVYLITGQTNLQMYSMGR